MGQVHDLYFDHTDWTTPYLVVDSGAWLFDRRVFISTSALDQSRWDYNVLMVDLTKAEVKDSPVIDLARPVTRAQEAELYHYYGWASDWNTPLIVAGGLSVAPVGAATDTLPAAVRPREVSEALENAEEAHVHSARAMTNDTIVATDGTLGHVADFILDDEEWVIRYLLVDTGNWLPGKKVLLSPRWVERVDWSRSHVYVDVTQAKVESSPEYDPSHPIQHSYERELHEHYGHSA